jgi:hypothetical protein
MLFADLAGLDLQVDVPAFLHWLATAPPDTQVGQP